MARATRVWRALKTLVWHERLAASPTDALYTVYQAVAPDQLAYTISRALVGDHHRDEALGPRRRRRAVGRVAAAPADPPADAVLGRRSPTRACSARVTVGGKPVWVVSFFDPVTPAWFEARIEKSTGRTLDARHDRRRALHAPRLRAVRRSVRAAPTSGCVGLSGDGRPRPRPPDRRGPPQGGRRPARLPLETLTPDENRANYEKTVQGAVRRRSTRCTRSRTCDADGVPVRIYRPTDTTEPQRALVYFHGGGFVVGSLDTHDGITRALARRADVHRRLGRLPARARASATRPRSTTAGRRRAG